MAGIEPAPLDLEMTSALLRASQPGTLPLSYVAADIIFTIALFCAACLQRMSISHVLKRFDEKIICVKSALAGFPLVQPAVVD